MQQTIKKSTSFKLGLALLAFSASLVATVVANADSYTVQSGDTLSAIAVNYNTTVDELVNLNNLTDANIISVGQVLEVGDGTSTATVTTETTTEAVATEETTSSYSSNLSESDAAAKEIIAQRESSGSYTAQNGQYYGRYQLTISYLNGDLSAENQERVADAYVASRYGSWTAALAFWNANGWY